MVLDDKGVIKWEETVVFDRDLSSYGTRGGVLRGDPEQAPLEVTAPSLMFVQSIDLLLEKLAESHIDIGHVGLHSSNVCVLVRGVCSYMFVCLFVCLFACLFVFVDCLCEWFWTAAWKCVLD